MVTLRNETSLYLSSLNNFLPDSCICPEVDEWIDTGMPQCNEEKDCVYVTKDVTKTMINYS